MWVFPRALEQGASFREYLFLLFGGKFDLFFFYYLDSSVQEYRGFRVMEGRFVSKCIEQWGIASGTDGALDVKERVARGVI